MSRIVTVISDVHMGLSHQGLTKIAMEHKIDMDALPPRDLVMFINRRKNAMKIFGHKGMVIGYLRMPGSNKITLEAIKYIPETFNGSGFSYQGALKKAVLEQLAKRK